MKGIILAAGRGSRMGVLTDNLPKCRTILHGKELIQWQLEAMEEASIKEISIVRGLSLIHISSPRDGLLSRMPSSA